MVSKKPLRTISINQVIVGMHIVGLDISWMDSPFLTHSKKIKTDRDLTKLKKSGAKVITIDPNKGLDLPPEDNELKAEKTNAPQKEKPNESADNPKRTDIEKELHVAHDIKDKLTRAIKNIQKDLAVNKAIKTQDVTPVIDQTLKSLERNNQALMSLAHISKRSQQLVDHAFSVFCIALNMAQLQNKSDEEKEALGIAAMLHEAGWANLPLQIMSKRNTLSPTEIKLLHKHPELGIKSLSQSELPALTLRIILEHHERNDGSGYPKKLTQENIHTLTQLFAVADAYDESIHQLSGNPGMLPTNALRALYVEAKKGKYDQANVKTLIAMLGIYPVSTAVKLTTGEKGVIIDVPYDKHLTPTVEVRYDSKGKPINEPKVIDLSLINDDNPVDIDSVLDPSKASDDPAQLLVHDL